MAAIHVKAAKTDGSDTIVFDADKAGLNKDGTPTQGTVRADGKAVTLEGRHMAVKQALREKVLVEVRSAPKAAKEDGAK
jgi:hypothetical protein